MFTDALLTTQSPRDKSKAILHLEGTRWHAPDRTSSKVSILTDTAFQAVMAALCLSTGASGAVIGDTVHGQQGDDFS